MNQDICAIVVSYHPRQEDIANLVFIREQVQWAVVVDNGSGQVALVALRETCRTLGINLIENGANLGIGVALNIGVKWAQTQHCDWVVLFDQDSKPTVGLVEKLLFAYIHDPQSSKIAVMIPYSVNPRTNRSTRGARRLGTGNVVIAQTSGSLIPITVFKKEGYFDESFFIDCVDWDYCLRLISHGWIIRQCMSAVLWHEHGSPVDYKCFGLKIFITRNYSSQRRYYQARNALWLFRRHAGKQLMVCIYILGNLGKNIITIFAERDRRRKFRAAFCGCLDGIFGNPNGRVRMRS
jgi:rhamnosyltransferase